ncbi:MAG TPA: stage II sporulation protein M [Chitinophagaceae bacterium]|nr:stage II sporulation protein M [Chitinophagaceae bacterium]
MREASFVERNKEKWSKIETNIKHNLSTSPDKLADDYIQLTNDLAYAQTFYPNSKTREYLNELSIYAHQSIFKDQKNTKNQFVYFFTDDIPHTVYQFRRPILYSFLITLAAAIIGLVSAHYDTDFVRLILGNAYVDQTIANIKAGNPAGIYGNGAALGSFLAITVNNIKVAFMAFALGIFWGIGTGYILLNNGIMLGAFHYLFYKYGVLGSAMSAIWIHGTFEISVIIIAGGCGIAIGNSILFPKTLKRKESFRKQIKKAAIILMSTVPFFIIAGLLEGFVSRHYQYSIVLSLGIIGISLCIILFYYVYYPYKLSKKYSWKD